MKLDNQNTFSIGQKVVCVKASCSLIKGETYTIKDFVFGGLGVILHEVEPLTNAIGFHVWRFIPKDDLWVEELLSEIVKEVESENLVIF